MIINVTIGMLKHDFPYVTEKNQMYYTWLGEYLSQKLYAFENSSNGIDINIINAKLFQSG